MVLVFSLSAYFTPASAGATFAASLCADGSEREIANLDQ
jgi:hypothetical protein